MTACPAHRYPASQTNDRLAPCRLDAGHEGWCRPAEGGEAFIPASGYSGKPLMAMQVPDDDGRWVPAHSPAAWKALTAERDGYAAQARGLVGQLETLRAERDNALRLVRSVDLCGTGFLWKAPDGAERVLDPAEVSVFLTLDALTDRERLAEMTAEAAQSRGALTIARRRGNEIVRLADELDRMRPVVEAAVAWVADVHDDPMHQSGLDTEATVFAAVDAYRSAVAAEPAAAPAQPAQDGPGAAGGTSGHPGPDMVVTVDTGLPQDACPRSRRADGLHSLRWDGDAPRTICVFCGEWRDALSGEVLGHQPVDGGAA